MAHHLETNAKRLQAAQERDQARFEAVAAEDRASQGWIDLALSLVTIAVGVAAIVMTAGAATPLVVGACVVGSCTAAYGASNLYEADHNIYLGSVGDGVTVATNPLRDTLFMGNDRLYHQIGGLFTTASAVMIPIGQTKSVAKGLTEFTIGEVGGFIGGQASYHGTRLLGGSEQDAQRATLVGNILGGFAASSAARRFSLNEPIAARVMKPTHNLQQLLKNLENSRLARESSRFKSYVAREKFTTTLAGMSPEDSQRYIQWHKYAKAGIEPVDRLRLMDWEYAPDVRLYKKYREVYNNPQYYDQITGKIHWPKDDGFEAGTKKIDTIRAGTIFNRYGEPSGEFLGSPIDLFETRALAPHSEYAKEYYYVLNEDCDMSFGKVAQWFGSKGGASQFVKYKPNGIDKYSIQELMDMGFLDDITDLVKKGEIRID